MGGSGLVMGVGWVWGAAAEAAGGRVGCFGVSGTGIELLLVLDCGIAIGVASLLWVSSAPSSSGICKLVALSNMPGSSCVFNISLRFLR